MKIMDEKTTIQRFIEMVEEKELSLEHPLQRAAGLWNNNKRQKFVSTLINGLYVPPFFIVQKAGSYLLDGLQRFTTVHDIINDNFVFTDDVKLFKNGTIYPIKGKKFSEIDKKLQDKILQFNFTMAYMIDATSREIEETFYNINDGEQMSESVKAKSILGIETANWLNKIIKNSFFVNKANFTEKQRNHEDETTTLYQYAYIINKGDNIEDLSKAEVNVFLRENRDVFTKDFKAEINTICDYISNSLPVNNDKYKKITKCHIPMLMMTAKQAIENNIDSKIFGEWIIQFFKDYKNSVYQNKGCGASNVKKEKTLVRIEEMSKHYQNYIALQVVEVETIKEESKPENKFESTTNIDTEPEKSKEEPKIEVKKEVKHSLPELDLHYNDSDWDNYPTPLPSSITGAYAESIA